MFNTELFIVEVQKRPWLWNMKDSSHNDRELKMQAWGEIAKLLNETSNSYSHTSKNITVEELQRKWKYLRDYFIREKKRTSKTADNGAESDTSDNRGSSVGRKKRKSPLLDMLQFLDVKREIKIVQMTMEQNVENINLETKIERETLPSEYERSCKRQRIEEQQSRLKEVVDTEEDPDKQFLKSLMPIIKNMSAEEKLTYQSQLLNSQPSEETASSSIVEGQKAGTPVIHKQNVTKASPIAKDVAPTKYSEVTMKRDEFSIYGEYVANKLRDIPNAQARHTAEFHINGILYKAEMGEFDIVSRNTAKSNVNSVSSRLSSSTSLDPQVEEEEKESVKDIFKTIIKTEVFN